MVYGSGGVYPESLVTQARMKSGRSRELSSLAEGAGGRRLPAFVYAEGIEERADELAGRHGFELRWEVQEPQVPAGVLGAEPLT